jgi:hypothetical protein
MREEKRYSQLKLKNNNDESVKDYQLQLYDLIMWR